MQTRSASRTTLTATWATTTCLTLSRATEVVAGTAFGRYVMLETVTPASDSLLRVFATTGTGTGTGTGTAWRPTRTGQDQNYTDGYGISDATDDDFTLLPRGTAMTSSWTPRTQASCLPLVIRLGRQERLTSSPAEIQSKERWRRRLRLGCRSGLARRRLRPPTASTARLTATKIVALTEFARHILCDAVEDNGDLDSSTVANKLDVGDSGHDGILGSAEGGADSDFDGLVDQLDGASGGDDIGTSSEGSSDADSNGVADYDSDATTESPTRRRAAATAGEKGLELLLQLGGIKVDRRSFIKPPTTL